MHEIQDDHEDYFTSNRYTGRHLGAYALEGIKQQVCRVYTADLLDVENFLD
jgi:hypothetical protein